MQDFVLLGAVAATFVFGWFLVKRLDGLLDANCHAQELQLQSGENILRLGFGNPTIADSITGILEQYSELYPDISVRMFCGSEEELRKGLSSGKLDVIFLPESAGIPARTPYPSREIFLNHTPVMMKYGGLPIEPLASGYPLQRILWLEGSERSFVCCFVKFMEKEVASPALQK